MTKTEKKAYFIAIQKRYHKANKAEKTQILNEFCQICGYHRKYAIRCLSQSSRATSNKKTLRRGRKPIYQDDAIRTVIVRIWLATDQICAKRLKTVLPLWLPFYEKTYESIDKTTYNKCLQMSASTIERLLKSAKVTHGRGLSGTKPGSLLKNKIPIKTEQWNESEPGFIEADTVAHCGNSLQGDFVWSLTMTDIATGWTECRATWGKGSGGVLAQIQDVENHLPFKLKGFDCDNGSEFLNHHLLRYFAERPQPVGFTRSRPYRKNDNAHVEQKNWTHVRQLFGYDRIANVKAVKLMNDLYQNEVSLLNNYFLPSVKLQSKTRVGGKIIKVHDTPKTPVQRMLENDAVTQAVKKQLQQNIKSLNPFELRRQIEVKLKRIFKHVKVTSNVRQRL